MRWRRAVSTVSSRKSGVTGFYDLTQPTSVSELPEHAEVSLREQTVTGPLSVTRTLSDEFVLQPHVRCALSAPSSPPPLLSAAAARRRGLVLSDTIVPTPCRL